MTIVEKLRKLITTKGGDPTGVMTIAEGVDRLEKTEEGGGGSSYHGFSPWPVDPTNSARVYCSPVADTASDVRICRDMYGYHMDDEPICYFQANYETDSETGDSWMTFGELTYASGYTPTETDISLCEYIHDSLEDYAQADPAEFAYFFKNRIMGENVVGGIIPGPSFYVML